MNARFEAKLHLRARLADAGEDDPRRIAAGGEDALELAATLAEQEGGMEGAVLATGSVTMAADVRVLLGVG